jgi:hypothetical protein
MVKFFHPRLASSSPFILVNAPQMPPSGWLWREGFVIRTGQSYRMADHKIS